MIIILAGRVFTGMRSNERERMLHQAHPFRLVSAHYELDLPKVLEAIEDTALGIPASRYKRHFIWRALASQEVQVERSK